MRLVFLVTLGFVSSLALANAEWESKKQKMEERSSEAASDMKRGMSKAGRSVKDKTCELVNGKMECLGEKAKHSIQNGADNVEDAAD